MPKDEMIQMLTESSRQLEEDLKNLELEFLQKKEKYIKIQGALEALNELKED